jgi:hypothetical protein
MADSRVPKQRVRKARVSKAPRQRAAGKVPNPRRPKLVRDVGGNELWDLFAFFPDLPRPARPAARLPARRRRFKL